MRFRDGRPLHPAGSARVGRSVRDRGASLVEVVAATAMMTIVVVPLGNAVIASVQQSSRSVENSKVITIAQNAADRVNRAAKGCDYTQFAKAAAANEGWPASTVAVVQEHFVPASQPTQQGAWLAGACESGVLTELLVQRVRITVVGQQHGMSSVIDVVKSDV